MDFKEKVGVYFCQCGSMISEKISPEEVEKGLKIMYPDINFKSVGLLCSEAGKNVLKQDILDSNINRVVIAACSPRDYELTFMDLLAEAGLNPYYMQMVNIREQVAWVTENPKSATEKSIRYIGAAINRVKLHEELHPKKIDVSTDALIVGAGPAGLKAALQIASAGRKVVLIDKKPAVGGMPVVMEEVYPHMECSPCMIEPLLADVLHGPVAKNIELLTMTEVAGLVGSFGNFIISLKKKARYVDIHNCIGCYECIEPCPVEAPNEFTMNLNNRKAIAFPFAGALPNAPFIDDKSCLRFKNEDCNICLTSCPVENTIIFDDKEETLTRSVGAILLAIGNSLYQYPFEDKKITTELYSSLEFERIMASNGPTGSALQCKDGKEPKSISFIHCVGSLDDNHKKYCSEVCCQYAFKLNRQIRHKYHDIKITHYVKEIVLPGKEAFTLYHEAVKDPLTKIVKYSDIEDLLKQEVENMNKDDMIVSCPAMVANEDAKKFAELYDIPVDANGFFEELHSKTDSTRSKLKGIYLAGTCQAPMSINNAMDQGMAATGFILSDLVSGRQLEISPVGASVDEEKCSGCKLCISVCPYKAISFKADKNKSFVDSILCQACGTCVAACPAGAIKGIHFTNEQILAEMEVLLS